MSVLLMLAVLGAAEDGTVVRCALAKTPKAEIATIQSAMVARVTAGTALPVRTEAMLARLRTRASECNPGSGASDSRLAEITISSVAVESLSTALQSRGVDVLAINGRLRRTPPAVLDQVLAKTRNPATEKLAQDMIALAGERGKQDAISRLIGGYTFNAARLAKLFASSAP